MKDNRFTFSIEVYDSETAKAHNEAFNADNLEVIKSYLWMYIEDLDKLVDSQTKQDEGDSK